jgi:hypothetical protein
VQETKQSNFKHQKGITLKKKKKKSTPPPTKKSIAPTVIFGCIVIVLVFLAFCFTHEKPIQVLQKEPSSAIHQKALAMGLFNAPPHYEERHVWISEHDLPPGRDGDTPVHILIRKDNQDTWRLCGTGTRLGKKKDYVLTAYHVFEKNPGQFGVRKIGPNEFTGNEPVIPVVECKAGGQADDAVICVIDEKATTFPLIEVPESPSMMKEWKTDQLYSVQRWPAKLNFTTYPEKEMSTVLKVEVRPGVFFIFFDWAPYHGESGTAAIMEAQKPTAYVVIIRAEIIPQGVYYQLPEEDRKYLPGWSPEKRYGVGVLVNVNQ